MDFYTSIFFVSACSMSQMSRYQSKFLFHMFLMCRSLFVPYFSFFLDLCISTLEDGQTVGGSDSTKPKKKKKKSSADADGSSVGLTLASWHLRQLVLSSLHKCFLHDTIDFLDSAKFQVSITTCFIVFTSQFANIKLIRVKLCLILILSTTR